MLRVIIYPLPPCKSFPKISSKRLKPARKLRFQAGFFIHFARRFTAERIIFLSCRRPALSRESVICRSALTPLLRRSCHLYRCPYIHLPDPDSIYTSYASREEKCQEVIRSTESSPESGDYSALSECAQRVQSRATRPYNTLRL